MRHFLPEIKYYTNQIVDNIINVTPSSQIYLLQEIQDEKYQLLFGDGLIGKKLGTRLSKM